jgi:hypothetical protein
LGGHHHALRYRLRIAARLLDGRDRRDGHFIAIRELRLNHVAMLDGHVVYNPDNSRNLASHPGRHAPLPHLADNTAQLHHAALAEDINVIILELAAFLQPLRDGVGHLLIVHLGHLAGRTGTHLLLRKDRSGAQQQAQSWLNKALQRQHGFSS